MKRAYLVAYNGASAAAWAYCVARGAAALAAGASAAALWADVGVVLMVVQTAMLLDIVHAALGLVRSPLATVAIQVASRIFVIWGQLWWVAAAQRHWGLYLIVLSWGVAETTRYAFYTAKQLGGVPYPLTWLRYSLFMVLYPSGISGEILLTLAALPYWAHAAPWWYRASIVILLTYVPGSPGMIGNMLRNRRKALGPARPARPLAGVCWPLDKRGARSTTDTAKAVLAAAEAAGPDGERAAAAVLRERNWRFGYRRHLLAHVKHSLASETDALNMARAGLAKASATFTFVRDGAETPLDAAMRKYTAAATAGGGRPYDTAEMVGAARGKQSAAAAAKQREAYLLYGGRTGDAYHRYTEQRATRIAGARLREQLDRWVAHGAMEPDTAEAIKLVQRNEREWLDLSGDTFVLLGASSAMGPLHFLLSLGANVVCVDLNIAPIWQRLFAAVRDTPGRIVFPVPRGTDWRAAVAPGGDLGALAAVAGSNLMSDTPEIAAWLASPDVLPLAKPLVIGTYVYLMGPLFPQITMACDAIIDHVCRVRGTKVSLAMLCTPTDAHVVNDAAASAAERDNYRAAPAWQRAFEALGVLKRNRPLDVNGLRVVDGIVNDQGPNYIISKRMQHWRAVVARAAGHTVSSNVAPSTATVSVMQNKTFAAGYANMHLFAGMEIVFQETSLSAMGALLIHDLKNPRSAAQASTKLRHPLCLMQATAFHGGVQRCPYTIASIGVPSALFFFTREYALHAAAAVAGLYATVAYLAFGSVPTVATVAVDAVPPAIKARLADAVGAAQSALKL